MPKSPIILKPRSEAICLPALSSKIINSASICSASKIASCSPGSSFYNPDLEDVLTISIRSQSGGLAIQLRTIDGDSEAFNSSATASGMTTSSYSSCRIIIWSIKSR
ncbi:unknown protein [Microcystis aeruginosa NIES-843]|uniref:Uncharacterized protein n=1 Tax=Microcystis aeruginosa (strain NIES-843 / IAM M-2473) TaxID=449447 RepID=B0JQ59_MICAN|nr:unknown protein [Microcystis aeruginosa NIES-843]